MIRRWAPFVLTFSLMLLCGVAFADAGHSETYHVHLDQVRECSDGGTCASQDLAFWQSQPAYDNPSFTDWQEGSVVSHEAISQGWVIEITGRSYFWAAAGSRYTVSGTTTFIWYTADIDPACDNGANPPACPAQECPFVVGETFIKSGSGARPSGFCDQNCSFTSDGPSNQYQDGWIGNYSVTGSCSVNDTPPPDTNLNCISTSAGNQHCMDPTAQENCGTVNGEYVCLGAAPQGGCIFTPSGQAICEGGSQANPPSETVTDEQGNDYDIYPTGSTGGSASGGATTGTNDTDGDGVPGGPTGQVGEEESEGSNITYPDLTDSGSSFESVTTGFYNEIAGGPWAQAVSGVGGVSSGATCPSGSFDFLGTTFNLDAHCTILDQAAPIFAILFLALWTILGARIVLEA